MANGSTAAANCCRAGAVPQPRRRSLPAHRGTADDLRPPGHQATAADIDGHTDVVTTDAYNPCDGLPFVLRGRGDGTFVRDDTVLARALRAGMPQGSGLWNVLAIPIGGLMDLVLGGTDQTVWFKGKGGGGFDLHVGDAMVSRLAWVSARWRASTHRRNARPGMLLPRAAGRQRAMATRSSGNRRRAHAGRGSHAVDEHLRAPNTGAVACGHCSDAPVSLQAGAST